MLNKDMALLRIVRRRREEAADVVIRILGGIAKDGTNESARVTACQVLLDRGWGKPGQPVTGADGEGDIRVTIRNIVEERKNS
jgi:hypothetical protein